MLQTKNNTVPESEMDLTGTYHIPAVPETHFLAI